MLAPYAGMNCGVKVLPKVVVHEKPCKWALEWRRMAHAPRDNFIPCLHNVVQLTQMCTSNVSTKSSARYLHGLHKNSVFFGMHIPAAYVSKCPLAIAGGRRVPRCSTNGMKNDMRFLRHATGEALINQGFKGGVAEIAAWTGRQNV